MYDDPQEICNEVYKRFAETSSSGSMVYFDNEAREHQRLVKQLSMRKSRCYLQKISKVD